MKKIGFYCNSPEELLRHSLCRKEDDKMLEQIRVKQELSIWDVDFIGALMHIENHWKAKLIEVEKISDTNWSLRTHTLEDGLQMNKLASDYPFDNAVQLIADKAPHFLPEQNRPISLGMCFDMGIPGILHGEAKNIPIDSKTDGKSCLLQAIRNLAIAFKLLPLEWHEEDLKIMRYCLYDTCINNLEDFRSLDNGVASAVEEKQKSMHSVSVKQPWCDLILSGKKKIENRSWKLYSTHNEEEWVAIHASKEPAAECPPDKLDFYKSRSGCICGMCLS